MQNLYLLIGPSGSGKTSVAEYLRSKGARVADSYTTRPPRYENEKGHTFVSDDEFDKLRTIVSYTEYGGYRYCVTKRLLDNSDVFVVDPKGVKCLEQNYIGKKLIKIWLSALPSTCFQRMKMRGDSQEQIQKRIDLDLIEFSGPVYRDIMTNNLELKNMTIDTNAMDISEVCKTVEQVIQDIEFLEYGLE